MTIESFPARLPEAVQRLYPFRTRTLHVPSLGGQISRHDFRQSGTAAPGEMLERMSYVDEGHESAPPLLLLHGNLTWSFLFRGLVERVRERFRVIAPDLVGFGLSSKPRDAGYHTLEQHTHNLTRLIAGLNLAKLTLVLHDWGGPIGLLYAMRFPENVSRIVLLNTEVHPLPDAEARPLWLRLAGSRFGGELLRRWRAKAWPDLSWGASTELGEAVRAGYSFPFRSTQDRVAPLAFARMSAPGGCGQAAMEELVVGVRKIRAKVQILWGEQDPVHRGKLAAYRLRDSFPNCGNPIFLPQASWLLPEDAPEALAEKVLQTAPQRGKEPLFKII